MVGVLSSVDALLAVRSRSLMSIFPTDSNSWLMGGMVGMR